MTPDRIVLAASGPAYQRQAALCIRSLRRVYDGRIDLLTDEPGYYRSLGTARIELHPMPDVCHPAAGRLRIPTALSPVASETILYLDCDVLATAPLALPDPGDRVGVYGYPHRSQLEPSFASAVSTDPAALCDAPFCSGVLWFRPSPHVVAALSDVHDAMALAIKKQWRSLHCWEQHHMNAILCSRGLADPCLDGLVAEWRAPSIPEGTQLLHFSGLRHGAAEVMERCLAT